MDKRALVEPLKARGHKYIRRWKGRDGKCQYEYPDSKSGKGAFQSEAQLAEPKKEAQPTNSDVVRYGMTLVSFASPSQVKSERH